MIGVVNIKDRRTGGYAIDIKYVKELIDDIEVSTLEDNTSLEYEEESVRVLFEHDEEKKYKIEINEKEFSEESVDIEDVTVQRNIIQAINTFRCYIDEEERDDEIKKIELILPHTLFCKNIGLWKDNDGNNLVDDCSVIIRSYAKLKQTNKKRKNDIILWKETLDSRKTFEDFSIKLSGTRFISDESKLSIYIENETEEETPFQKISKNCRIGVWINNCNDIDKYSNFLTELSSHNMDDLPLKLRTLMATNANNCSTDINFMWDDPNILLKANYE